MIKYRGSEITSSEGTTGKKFFHVFNRHISCTTVYVCKQAYHRPSQNVFGSVVIGEMCYPCCTHLSLDSSSVMMLLEVIC